MGMFKMKKEITTLLLASLIALTGCTNDNQTNGAVIGGITGGLIGSAFGKGDGKIVAVAVGTLSGALIGSSIGAKMDEKDRHLSDKAVQQATHAHVGERIIWNNDSNGHYGSAKTIKIGVDKDGRPCRQIEQEINIDGKKEIVIIDIVQMSDGHWVVAQ
jgi:surface antigen